MANKLNVTTSTNALSIATGADAGNYVVIDNAGVAGFNGAGDALIKLTAGAANVKATSFIV
jgi:hypothetical protein